MLPPDPAIRETAERLFRTHGYQTVVLSDVATASGVALPAVLLHYPDKTALLHAILEHHDPRREIKLALRLWQGNTPEEMVHHAVQQLFIIFDNHAPFAYFAMLDMQFHEGGYIKELLHDITAEAAGFLNRLSTMPKVRPLSTMMLGRALAAFLLGFMGTQLLAPEGARVSLRVFPQKRGWTA